MIDTSIQKFVIECKVYVGGTKKKRFSRYQGVTVMKEKIGLPSHTDYHF